MSNNGICLARTGAENDRDLAELLLNDAPGVLFPKQYLETAQAAFENTGFSIIGADEAFRPIKFWDIGVLVWFTRIIFYLFLS